MQPVVNYDHKTIQVRRGSTTEWRRYGAICIPAEGEICVEFFQDADGSRNGNTGMKIGNGTSNYTDLPYLITNQNQDDRISDDQINNWDLTVEKLANLVASEVGQTNADLGDNVQEALNDLHSRLLAIDPDGGSIEINDIPGLEDALNGKAEQSDLEKEIQDRKDGDQALQDQIDALDPDGDRKVDWSEIDGKPSEFPPETHGHEIADVDGLQDALDTAGGAPAWDDVTGKPTEFPPAAHNQDWSTIENTPSEYPPESHTHGQDEVDGLELRLDAIEGSISSGGGFVEAPNDGQLYGRQSEAWAVVPAVGAPAWDEVTGKPAEFPPEAHNHITDDITGLDDELDEIKGDITDLEGAVGGLSGQLAMGGSYDASTGLVDKANLSGFEEGQPLPDYSTVSGTFVIVTVAGDNPETLGEADWLVAGDSGWVAIKYGTAGSVEWDNIQNVPSEFPPEAHNHDGVYQPVGDYIGEAPNDGEEYARKNQGWVKLQDHNYTGADAVKLTGDQSVAGHKTWTGVATFGDTVTMRGTLNGDDTANFQNAVTAGSFVKTGGTSGEYLMADGSVSSGGGFVDAPNDGKLYGRQSEAWEEITSTGGGSSLWEQNGDDIYYSDGNVGIGGSGSTRRLYVESDQQAVAQFVSTSNVKASLQIGCANSTNNNNQWIGTEGKDLRFATGNQTRLTIDASGNVGIGTDEISGLSGKPTVHINDKAGNGAIRVGNSNSDGGNLFIDHSDTGGVRIRANEADMSIGTHSVKDLKFHTNGESNTRLTIDNEGDATFSGSVFLQDQNARFFWNGTADETRLFSNGGLQIRTGGFTEPDSALTIDANGNVGIGMTPEVRTAKEQLAEWKSQFDARLKAEPKADKKAVTLEITDDAFEVLPSEDKLAEWMETRGAGDKLQVQGDISASGKVSADGGLYGVTWRRVDINHGLAINVSGAVYSAGPLGETDLGTTGTRFKDAYFSGAVNASKFVSVNSNGYSSGFMSSVGNDNDYALIPTDAAGIATDGAVSLGRTKVNNATNEVRFKDAYFSGAVNANNVKGEGDKAGFLFDGAKRIIPTENGSPSNGKQDLGATANKFKDAYFSETVNANKFVGDGSGLTGLPSGGLDQGTADGRYVKKSGNSTVTGTITATDFIATSDERRKDNITPVPIGLIDDIKPVSWDWKDGSGKSAGVVAQQLQAIGLDDYVHEDDDGQLGVNYQALTAILLAEVINLKTEVEALKS